MYILIWCEYHADSKEWIDHWAAYSEQSAAQEHYTFLKALISVKTASICGVIESTDYEAAL